MEQTNMINLLDVCDIEKINVYLSTNSCKKFVDKCKTILRLENEDILVYVLFQV